MSDTIELIRRAMKRKPGSDGIARLPREQFLQLLASDPTGEVIELDPLGFRRVWLGGDRAWCFMEAKS